jgi:hypothetical protein
MSLWRCGPLKFEESAIFLFEALQPFLRDSFLARDFGNWKNKAAQ